MDALSDILRSVRLSSSIWSTARLTVPFAVRTRGAPGAIFHVVARGEASLETPRAPDPITLSAGHLALLPQGDGHVIADRPGRAAVPIADLMPDVDEATLPCLIHGGGGEETFLICGAFHMDHAGAGSLLSLLPPLLHVHPDDGELAGWFESTLLLMERELARSRPGVDTVLARLSDVLFVQVLRATLDSLPAQQAGWLAALRDEQIGRALALIHAEPSERWNADRLARRVAMSRSTFFDRFTKLVGEPPARYLARWRVHTAADLMQRTRLSNAELAERVGYRSEDAFGKVFKRHTGLTPREYRARVDSNEAAAAM